MNTIIVNRIEHPPVSKGTGVKCTNPQIRLVYRQQGLQLKNFFESVEFCKGSGEKKKLHWSQDVLRTDLQQQMLVN